MRDITHGRVEITDEPTLIFQAGQDVSSVKIYNFGPATVFVGSAAVAVEGESVGYPIPAEGHLDVPIYPNDSTEVFGIVAEGDAVISFLSA